MVPKEYARKVAEATPDAPGLNPRAIESTDGRVLAGASNADPNAVTVFVAGHDDEMIIITSESVKLSKGGACELLHRWGWEPGIYLPR